MGECDLYESDRPRKVTVSEWVWHLLRYWDGCFVCGLRGQRVLCALLGKLVISERSVHLHGSASRIMKCLGVPWYALEFLGRSCIVFFFGALPRLGHVGPSVEPTIC